MELKNQVCSLEYAKKLKELGVKQESLFYYVGNNLRYAGKLSLKQFGFLHKHKYLISAFTVAELGEMLPNGYRTLRMEGQWMVFRDRFQTNSIIGLEAKTEAGARVKCLIYLIENNLIKL